LSSLQINSPKAEYFAAWLAYTEEDSVSMLHLICDDVIQKLPMMDKIEETIPSVDPGNMRVTRSGQTFSPPSTSTIMQEEVSGY